MKNLFVTLVVLLGVATACGSSATLDEDSIDNTDNDMNTKTVSITAGEKTFIALLADNSSAEAFWEYLSQGDRQIRMSDYAGMEKVGPLGTTLPRNDHQINTSPGDLILYQGNQFVIYYGTNSWSLTRLGRIVNVSQRELLDALGEGDVTVTLSINQ